jgi:hypothetical protein
MGTNMDINLANLEILIRGERMPANRAEELFLMAYKAGLGDELLLFTLIGLRDIFEGLSGSEKDFFVLGYCLGQKTFRDVEDSSFENLTNITKITQ